MRYTFLLLLVALSSCLYKLPSDDNLCTVPNTNNPQLTREKPTSWIVE